MNKVFKRTLGATLAAVMTVSSMLCMSAFAANDINKIGAVSSTNDEIPEGLPAGAYKVYEGIYAVDNFSLPKTRSFHEDVNIGTVYPVGQITQPGMLSNFVVESGHKWVCVQSQNAYIRINFVRKNTSIFGSNYYDWPAIGTLPTTTYFIEADFYDMERGVPYQVQCTSGNGRTYNNVIVSITSSSEKYYWD